MEIIHISAECYPVAKVGGLADVVGALAKTQTQEGLSVKVVIPYYNLSSLKTIQTETIFSSDVKLGQFNFPFSILKAFNTRLEFDLYLIVIPELFDREEIYGYRDDIERFVAFQIAFLNWQKTIETIPSVLHCHDYHSALIPFMITHSYEYNILCRIPTLLTLHNALYQGQFGFDKLHYLPQYDLSKTNILEWGGNINSIAAGLRSARAITTVSPSYLEQINTNGYGLEYLFREVRYKSKGILNGIDTEVWNPETDNKIAAQYGIKNATVGKKINKEKLCEMFHLDVNIPIICFIGRLYEEKGADLLYEFSKKTLQENAEKFNILILGSGNEAIEKQLQSLVADSQGVYNLFVGFDEDLAHLIYGGSDFILMPSRTESCGLNQMYGYRYGTIPVVRKTGGLIDTVQDIDKNGLGICFQNETVEDITSAIERAVTLFENKEKLNTIIKSGMMRDHSWNKANQDYLKMYKLIIK
ncbi:glycogen synthase [Flavobacterium algicola]|uniref:glycogen synthase n=1 Tax=Flavobacterium algicola TaxID=556529 RepID=UPI001EFCA721|nr:glycogen/starch synthase [Flavobacterium algicola]MCG9792989.1 glycogen/starch synthase [Flavobacterium algicola]